MLHCHFEKCHLAGFIWWGENGVSGVCNGVIGCNFYVHIMALLSHQCGIWSGLIIFTLLMKHVQYSIEFEERDFFFCQWMLSQTGTKKAIKHQQNCIIPMMTSVLSISIFHYFRSQLFLMLNIPVCCLLKGICFSDFSLLEKWCWHPPNQTKSPSHRVTCLPYGSV